MENKRSLKYLIVAACLALLVASIGGIVVGAQTPPEESSIKILGATLDLNDQVSIGYVVDAEAVGYNEADGSVQHYVYTYSTNPTGTANEGTKLENYVYKTYADGSAYVIFLTDGYAVANYSNDVFARVVEGEKVGEVKKAGVYELANLMLKQGVSNNATKLVNALVKYHDAAYKVINGTASPYKFVSVADGYIVGEDGFSYTSAVVAAGTQITLADKVDEESKGAVLTGWNNGTSVSESSVVTVSASVEYAPEYALVSDVNYNPFATTWYANYMTDNTTVTNGNIGATYWNAVIAGIKGMGEANAVRYINPYQADTHDKGYADLTRYVFRDETTGTPIIKHSYTKTPPIWDATNNKFVDIYAGMGKNHNFNFENNAEAGQYLDISFDIMLPSIDKDGDGIYNEANAQAPTSVEDPLTGEIKDVPLQYGDWFTNATNDAALRFPIGLSDNQSNTMDANCNVLWINLSAKRVDGIVTGFYLGTSGGESTSQADKNGVYDSKTIYELDRYYTITARLTADDDGAVAACTVLVDGTPIVTRTAAAGNSKQGLSYMTWDGSLKLTGENAHQYVGFATAAVGRYSGDYYIKNFNASVGEKLTAAEVEAAPAVVAAVDTVFPALHSKRLTATPTAQSTLGAPIIGEYKLREYNDYGSWVYDANLNSYTIVKNATSNAGNFNLHVTNPMNGLSAEERAGKAVAFEFKMSMPAVDSNGDGILSESKNDIGRQTSSVAGSITIGVGDGANGNATPNNGMIGLFRVTQSNMKSKLVFNQFGLQAYGLQNGKLNEYSTDNSQVWVASSRNSGQVISVKIVMTPNAETGIVEKQETYINGTLVNTRTYDGTTDSKTCMNYPLAKISDSNNYYNGLSIFTQKYVNFSYMHSANALHNMMFADFNAYIVDATN